MVFDVLEGGHLVEGGCFAAAFGVMFDGEGGEEVGFGRGGEAPGGVARCLLGGCQCFLM